MQSSWLSSFSLSDNIIGYIIEGPYDDAMVQKIQREVWKKLEVYDKLNFYIEDTHNARFFPMAILKSIPFKLKTGNRFEKVAVVTDRKWLRYISNFENLIFRAEIRVFSGKRRLEAIHWISHQQEFL